jgi:hypothetical protein
MPTADKLRARAAHFRSMQMRITDEPARQALEQAALDFEQRADALDQNPTPSDETLKALCR